MKKTNNVMILIMFILLLSGCSEKPRTVKYYVEHPDEIRPTLKHCDEQTQKNGKLDDVLKQNCQNAIKANVDIIRSKISQ